MPTGIVCTCIKRWILTTKGVGYRLHALRKYYVPTNGHDY